VHYGDVMLATSDIGWIVGHNFIVYGPLVRGGTTVVYEGKPVGTPDPGACFRLIDDYKVN
jgi:propionyl-CoA synthetase